MRNVLAFTAVWVTLVAVPAIDATAHPRGGPAVPAALSSSLARSAALEVCEVTKRSRRHPRHRRRRASMAQEHYAQLKVGRFNPDGPADDGLYLGFATGTEFDQRLTVGFHVDYARRTFVEEVRVAEEVDPTGNVVRRSYRSLDTSSNLVPLSVQVGVRLPGSQTVTPFVGAGLAYNILVNEIVDFERRIDDVNAYGGFGWQLTGGLVAPISPNARLMGEFTWSDGDVSRDIDHYVAGLPVRETIDVSGVGVRLGFEFNLR